MTKALASFHDKVTKLGWLVAWTFALRTPHVQGSPVRSRQSNLAVFTIEGGLDSKFPDVK